MNWELWWPQFPVLVYFKETQTKPEGQIHFFPVIFVSPLIYHNFNSFIIPSYGIQFNSMLLTQNGRQLYDVMVERAGPSKASGPK